MNRSNNSLKHLAGAMMIFIGLILILGAFGNGGSLSWLPFGIASIVIGFILIGSWIRPRYRSWLRKIDSLRQPPVRRSKPVKSSKPRYSSPIYVWDKDIFIRHCLIFLGCLMGAPAMWLIGLSIVRASDELGGTLLVGGIPISLLFFGPALALGITGLISLYHALNLTIRYFTRHRK